MKRQSGVGNDLVIAGDHVRLYFQAPFCVRQDAVCFTDGCIAAEKHNCLV